MYKNSKYTVLFPLLLAAGVVLGLLLGQYMGRNSTTSEIKGMLRQMALPTNKLTYTLSLIENQYVDSVAMDSLAEHVIPLLVKELDPHSVYIPASEMQEINEPLEGEFDGIGVVFNMATDTVIVLNVIPQGPSDKAGIKAGDRIIEINDTLVAGQKIPQRDVVKKLRGPRGTTVHLGLGRQGISDLVGVDVVRDKIPIKSVESAFCIADGIGYIKLGQFARTTFDEMQASLDTLRAQGATKLIFDLRGNSGGYLDQAIMVANEFLHKDQLIVYTEDRQHKQLREYADGTGAAQDMDVVVLIDEGSASSSEILAGALQDNDRGTIVGRRSFGKGLVQRQIPYSDGSALRLTTARYYTPTGRSIQKPYTIGDDESYEEDIWNRYKNNEFFSADSIHFADSLKRVTPGGKVVYGGGIRRVLFRPGRYDRRNEIFCRGGGAQHPLPLYDRICRPSPRSSEQGQDDPRTPGVAGQRQGPRGGFHPLCGTQGRRSRLPGHRPLAKADRGPAEGLYRPQHGAGGQWLLRQHLSRRQRGGACHRDIKRYTEK